MLSIHWIRYCIAHVNVSFIVLVVCVLIEWKQICACLLIVYLFCCVLVERCIFQKWEGWDHNNRFNPDVQYAHVVLILCSMISSERELLVCWYWWNYWPPVLKPFFFTSSSTECDKRKEYPSLTTIIAALRPGSEKTDIYFKFNLADW